METDLGGIESALRAAAMLPLHFFIWSALIYPLQWALGWATGSAAVMWPVTIGLLCLVVGTVLGLLQSPRRLLILLAPAVLGHVIAGVGGFFAGAAVGHQDGNAGAFVLWMGALGSLFVVATLVLIGYLVVTSMRPRTPWVLIGLFDASYVLFAARFAIISVTDAPVI